MAELGGSDGWRAGPLVPSPCDMRQDGMGRCTPDVDAIIVQHVQLYGGMSASRTSNLGESRRSTAAARLWHLRYCRHGVSLVVLGPKSRDACTLQIMRAWESDVLALSYVSTVSHRDYL